MDREYVWAGHLADAMPLDLLQTTAHTYSTQCPVLATEEGTERILTCQEIFLLESPPEGEGSSQPCGPSCDQYHSDEQLKE